MRLSLVDKISEGEHQQQDFKFCITSSKKIAKSLVAFANSDGGRLLIGVKDNGVVAGVVSDEELYMIEAAAKIYSRPQIEFEVEQHHYKGKYVLEVIVSASSSKPHFAKEDDGRWMAYIRYKDENLLASATLVKIWKRERSKQPVFISYNKNYQLLLEHVEQNEIVSIKSFSRYAKLAYREAENIIIQMVLLNILTFDSATRGVLFSLNEDFDRGEWDQKIIHNQ